MSIRFHSPVSGHPGTCPGCTLDSSRWGLPVYTTKQQTALTSEQEKLSGLIRLYSDAAVALSELVCFRVKHNMLAETTSQYDAMRVVLEGAVLSYQHQLERLK